jgi:hypothetical protein
MAVVDELVAKIGIQAEGLDKLKKFEDGLKSAKKSFKDFHAEMKKTVGGGSSPIAKVSEGVTKASAAWQKFGSVLKTIMAALTGAGRSVLQFVAATGLIAGGIVGAIAMLAKLALAFVRVRGEAARARRGMQLDALGKRTTAAGIENMQKGWSLLSGGNLKDSVKEYAGSLAPDIDSAISGGEDKFKKGGIAVTDGDGNQRDTLAVMSDITSKYADMMSKAKALRRNAEIAKSRGGKGRNALVSEANKTELGARKFAKDMGIPAEMQAMIRDLRDGSKQIQEALEKANRIDPGRTKDEEDRSARIATQFYEVEQKINSLFSGMRAGAINASDALTENLLPAMNRIADGALSFAKTIGIVRETVGERKDREAAAETLGKNTPEEDAMLRDAGRAGRVQRSRLPRFMWTDEQKAAYDVQQAEHNYRTVKKGQAGLLSQPGGDPNAAKALIEEWANALRGALERFNALSKDISPDAAIKKSVNGVQQQTENKTINDNRHDIGNDKRNMPISITVNATGLDAAAARLKGAVFGAISTKAGNTSTAAATAS